MTNQIIRTMLRTYVPKRALSIHSAYLNQKFAIDPVMRDRAYPKLGNRDIVGYGFNGEPNYADREDFPCPAIRFKENSAEVMRLREKEMGDWKNLTLQEKKALYRASFRQTYAEMTAPTGEWRSVLAGTIFVIAIAGWFAIFMEKFVYQPFPSSFSKEWQEESIRKQVIQRHDRVEGISSKFDYEKNDWKN